MTSKPWGLYGTAFAILLAAFAAIALQRPDDIESSTDFLIIGAGLVILLALVVPPPALARLRATVPVESKVPFSRSVADRVEASLITINRVIGWLAVIMAVGMGFVQLTTTLSGWQEYTDLANGLLAVGTVVFSLGLIVVIFVGMERAKKRFPPDDEELERKALLGSEGMAGIYRNNMDPMVVLFVPSNELNVTTNLAHPEGRRYLYLVLASALAFLVLVFLVAQ